jgi:hypothetical protein
VDQLPQHETHEHEQGKKPSRFRRVSTFLFLWILPLIIIGLGVWIGNSVFAAVLDRIEIQQQYHSNSDGYEAEATSAGQQGVGSNSNSEIALVGFERSRRQDPTPPPLVFATNTPAPEIPVTLPPLNTIAPTEAPATLTPVPVEPLILPTVLLPQNAPDDIIAPTAVPEALTPITRDYDLVNIVLLGSDEGDHRRQHDSHRHNDYRVD